MGYVGKGELYWVREEADSKAEAIRGCEAITMQCLFNESKAYVSKLGRFKSVGT